MKDFRSLKVWQKSHQLVLAIYNAIASFPDDEKFGLSSQIRRSGVSIPSNIAEGCGRDGDAEFARFLHIAMGSASELEYQLLLARDLGFLKESGYRRLADNVTDVKKMLASLIRKLKADR